MLTSQIIWNEKMMQRFRQDSSIYWKIEKHDASTPDTKDFTEKNSVVSSFQTLMTAVIELDHLKKAIC